MSFRALGESGPQGDNNVALTLSRVATERPRAGFSLSLTISTSAAAASIVALILALHTPLLAAQMPTGWRTVGSGDTSRYQVNLDHTVRHDGLSSGHIRSTQARVAGFTGFAQSLRPDRYLGKRVRFSAWLRTVDAERAGLWLRVDGDGEILGFDNMMDRAVEGTVGWKRYSVVLDVPPGALGITFGVLLGGGGQVWIDDAILENVGMNIPVTHAPRPERSGVALPDSVRRIYERRSTTPMNLEFEH